MSTFGGFVKLEMYMEINNLFVTYKDSYRDALIKKIVDLCYTKGELTNLLSLFIECFINSTLSKDLSFVSIFLQHVIRLQALPRKNITNSILFQNNIIDIISILTLKERKPLKFYKIINNLQNVKKVLESYSFEIDDNDKDTIEFEGEMPVELYQQFVALKQLIRSREKKLAIGLAYIICNKQYSEYSMGSLNISGFTYNDPKLKKDLILFVWKLIYNISNNAVIIDRYFFMYNIGLNKKNKPDRLNILLYSVLILAINNNCIHETESKSLKDYETLIIKKRDLINLNEFFNYNINNNNNNNNNNSISNNKKNANNDDNVDNDDKNEKNYDEIDDELEYLKCITYLDNYKINEVYNEKADRKVIKTRKLAVDEI
jgi:hypothetical protein